MNYRAADAGPRIKCWIASWLLASLLIPMHAWSQQQRAFGEWSVISADDRSGDVIAVTGTESGKELLGYRCYLSDGKCRYVLLPNTRCVSGSEYPILINAPAGASSVTGHCTKGEVGDQLLLAPWESVESAIKGSRGQIGFAIPMESGAFRAVRFELRGGYEATQEAERQAIQRRRGGGSGSPSPTQRRTGSSTF